MSEGEQVSSGVAAGPAVLRAALNSICRSHADGEGQQPQERQSCKSPSLHGASGPVTGPTPGHLQNLAPIPETAQLHRPWEEGHHQERGQHSYHHSYASFEISGNLFKIHLCLFIKNDSCSDVPMLSHQRPWRPYPWGWKNAQAPLLCKELQDFGLGLFFTVRFCGGQEHAVPL